MSSPSRDVPLLDKTTSPIRLVSRKIQDTRSIRYLQEWLYKIILGFSEKSERFPSNLFKSSLCVSIITLMYSNGELKSSFATYARCSKLRSALKCIVSRFSSCFIEVIVSRICFSELLFIMTAVKTNHWVPFPTPKSPASSIYIVQLLLT